MERVISVSVDCVRKTESRPTSKSHSKADGRQTRLREGSSRIVGKSILARPNLCRNSATHVLFFMVYWPFV